MREIVFLGVETTGADPSRHVIWEIAVIAGGKEHVWNVELSLEDLQAADREALRVIGSAARRQRSRHYFEEVNGFWGLPPRRVAGEVVDILHRATPVGIRVASDLVVLRAFIVRHHVRRTALEPEPWPVKVPAGRMSGEPEVETAGAAGPRETGALKTQRRRTGRGLPDGDWDHVDLRPVLAERFGRRPPWPGTEALAGELGLTRDWHGAEPRRSALGHARFAKRIYEALYR